ncbi:hypothetical protein PG996_013376 [Apiospora saccharicola]|uniref:Uncharacterized protein n=1 Tax=Apiospora saccharicola TaxID=335842 RepID=A0ABR1U5A0_9PEZI
MPYIWSEIDVCVVLLFSCGLSAREVLHSSKKARVAPRPPRPPRSSASWALRWPSYLAHHFRLPGRTEGGHHRPREAAAATTSNAFQERIAWLELLNSHSPYVVPGSHRPLGTQIMIESFPSAKAATSAVETPTPTTAHTNWCRHSRIDEVEECGKGKKQSMGGGIMVTREVVCTVEETIISGKHGEEEGEGHDQDMSSSSGPGSVIFTTTNEHIG